ncbi:MAG: aldehyde dehydrogenase family protein [Deltaproteobacteria bacterium]|nr:aldehyde dehydrogenase family protein [Deltaproteobacteria bacterium]
MHDFLKELGIEEINSGVCGAEWLESPGGSTLQSISPIDGNVIAGVKQASTQDYEQVVEDARKAFLKWRMMPAPKRGTLVRDVGNALREKKSLLGKLVTLEMGKILAEGEGEVQEMIDVGDFALGLSRQLYGLTMHSERPLHRMYEQWHPLGPIGIITAFNFPVAVWAWNALVAGVCGDTMVWKPSSKVPLCGIAVQKIVHPIAKAYGVPGLFGLAIGSGRNVGESMIADRRLPLISATGSVRMGKRIGQVVGARLGRSLLELGGNNPIIVMDDADLDLAVRAILFGAVGTAGQRCTTTRRLIMHQKIAGKLTDMLEKAYSQIKIGNPMDPSTLMGPLIDTQAVNQMMSALDTIKAQKGEILYGGHKLEGPEYPGGCYVEPTLVKAHKNMEIIKEETFAPILYLITVNDLEEAVSVHNDVPQGLSSAIFTNNLLSSERFLSHQGSDCGIANVNIGTSGAEIGGAFGGEKDTGGGRESGSDAWKAYMRRQTNTINWGKELPLAQGIKFDIP